MNECVYNGIKKFNAQNEDFMTNKNIINAMKSIKSKNSEGFD